jgi:hypothetical protein
MPKVPQYNQQVQNQAAPNVQFNNNAPIEAFGGGRAAQEAGAVRELAGVAGQIAIKAREDADDVAFAEQAEKLKRARIDLEMNPERGLLNRRGKDAFDLGRESEESWEKASSEILASAPNDRVRERLSRAKAVEGLSMFEKVQSHVSREMRAHDEEVTKGLTETAANDAVLNKDDPSKIDFNLGIAKKTISDYAARNGKGAEYVNAAVTSTFSKTHAAIISQMIDSGNTKQAKLHFEQYEDQIQDAAILGKVKENLKVGTRLAEATRASDDILATTNDMSTAMSRVRQIEDPEIRKEAQGMVLQHLEIRRKADRDRSEQTLNSYLTKLEASGGTYNLPPSAATGVKTEHLKVFEERKAQLLGGKSIPPNGPAYYDLRMMAADPAKVDKFKDLNLLEYSAMMPSTELSKMIELQADMRKGKAGKSAEELGEFRTKNEVMNTVLNDNKIDVTPKPGSSDADVIEKLRSQVERHAVTYKQETGKTATNEMIREWSEAYLTEVVTKKRTFWFDEKKKTIDAFTRYKDIPSTDRSLIEEALRKSKKPVTPQAVEELYLKNIIKNGQK